MSSNLKIYICKYKSFVKLFHNVAYMTKNNKWKNNNKEKLVAYSESGSIFTHLKSIADLLQVTSSAHDSPWG